MSGRVFIADYDRSDATKRVWVPLAIAGANGIAALVLQNVVLTVFAMVFTAIAVRHWPLVRTERPALILSDDGVELDGLGRVAWADVASVERGMVQVKALKRPAIDLGFKRALPQVFKGSEATRLRPWEVRFFKLRRDGKLRLDLAMLADDADEIFQAFRYFQGMN